MTLVSLKVTQPSARFSGRLTGHASPGKRANISTFRASQVFARKSISGLYHEMKSELIMRRRSRSADTIFLGVTGLILGCGGYFAANYVLVRSFSWPEMLTVFGITCALGLACKPVFDFLGRKKTALFRLKAEISPENYRKFIHPLMNMEKRIEEEIHKLTDLGEKPSPVVQSQLERITQEFNLAEHQEWLKKWYTEVINSKVVLLNALQEVIGTYLDDFLSIDPQARQKRLAGIQQGIEKYSATEIYEAFCDDGRAYLFLKKIRGKENGPKPA